MLKIVIKPLVAMVSCYFEEAHSNTFSMRINYIIFYLRMHVLNPYDIEVHFLFFSRVHSWCRPHNIKTNIRA